MWHIAMPVEEPSTASLADIGIQQTAIGYRQPDAEDPMCLCGIVIIRVSCQAPIAATWILLEIAAISGRLRC
jgi:hypothetical protein